MITMAKRVVQVLLGVLAMVSVSEVFAGGSLAGEVEKLGRYGAYVEARFGVADVGWHGFNSSWDVAKKEERGVAYGALGGARLYHYLFAEVGGYVLPDVTYTASGAHSIESYALYAAGKLAYPVTLETTMTMTAGVGYRNLTNSNPDVGNGGVTGPVFGVGFNYQFTRPLWVTLNYVVIPGRSSEAEKNNAPNASILMAGVVYHFM